MLLDRVSRALAPQFALEREVGRGGMGVVYRAQDTVLHRPVAVKVLLPEKATAVSVERFLREARLLARLRHPSIVSIHQAGQAGEFLYFAMDLVDGESLDRRLQRGPLAPAAVRALARDLLSALAAAHAAGIIHRDVKPGNIFLQGDRALLADFGIAWVESDTTLTLPGITPGTLAFVAPEQRLGHPATPATDVYSAALVLCCAATGAEKLDPAADERRIHRALPRELRGPVRRALAPRPDDRWPDAATFQQGILSAAGKWRHRLATISIPVALALVLLWSTRAVVGPACESTDPWLPAASLPAGRELRCLVLSGEHEYNAGRWREAEQAYRTALEQDSACALCAWRLMDIERWLERPQDPDLRAAVVRGAPALPPVYRALVAAESLPNPQRLDRLEAITQSYRGFYLAWYRLGEEQFHRGPLYGRPMEDGLVSLRRAVQLNQAFTIPWIDLVLGSVSAGDSVQAFEAIAQLSRQPPPSQGVGAAVRAMAEVAFAFRYGDGKAALLQVLADSTLRSAPELAAGPRLLAAFAQPEGAIHFGQQFERESGDPRLEVSGLLGQLFGYVATGHQDSLRTVGDRLTRRLADASWRRIPQGLDRILTTLDPDQRVAGRSLVAELIRSASAADHGVDPLLDELHAAWRVADAGRTAAALAQTESLVDDPNRLAERDPLLRALVYLSRGIWFERAGNVERARREYRWYRHFDVPDADFPQGFPTAAEVDWALGPLAAFRLARMLDDAGVVDRELCDALALVARVWRQGDARHQARAEWARQRSERRECGPP